MQSFIWDNNYETGVAEVDNQHHQLVDVINRFGDQLAENRVLDQIIDNTFAELADYTRYHFSEEEEMMAMLKIDPRHLTGHVDAHQLFLTELVTMKENLTPGDSSSSQQLLDFLIHWLAYHILGTDKNMARQVRSIQAGMTPEDAYDEEERQSDSSTEPLLVALNGLFHLVSTRNAELLRLNLSLEEKVAERTAELQKANLYLEELTLTDTLTRLPNRRHAMRQLSLLWEEAEKIHADLVVMMVDADHFKEVNDTYGHDAGDRVLCELSKTLRHAMRTDDIVCRLGGDEFLIICPFTAIEDGLQVAHNPLNQVNQLRVETGDGYWQGSISIGVGAKRAGMADFEDLIKMADRGVYAAKSAGKNCIRAGE
ncbi:MAG: GGDEF domain-containing protein [Gammaproteobacteria bacterium]|nr:GGDEF domain-containing protein [Gammaproteobacteria bacterium]